MKGAVVGTIVMNHPFIRWFMFMAHIRKSPHCPRATSFLKEHVSLRSGTFTISAGTVVVDRVVSY
jgi:hypothetical protein